jgi:F-type H+-transporting ATPase subunit gamma
MPSLKEYRNRIKSVKSTRKITSAMKMVAAAKLRRAQDLAVAARPYAEKMEVILASLVGGVVAIPGDTGIVQRLLFGTGADKNHLLVVATSDRGLCGAFNSSIARRARVEIRRLLAEGRNVSVLCAAVAVRPASSHVNPIMVALMSVDA